MLQFWQKKIFAEFMSRPYLGTGRQIAPLLQLFLLDTTLQQRHTHLWTLSPEDLVL
jgi:hypothetical protein